MASAAKLESDNPIYMLDHGYTLLRQYRLDAAAMRFTRARELGCPDLARLDSLETRLHELREALTK
jgi:hypothetical protein